MQVSRPASFAFWSALTLLIGALMTAYFFKPQKDDSESQSNRTVVKFQPAKSFEVKAVGTEFHWEFHYPGPDGQLDTADDFLSVRRLTVPSQSKVKLHVTSNDYAYILRIPKQVLLDSAETTQQNARLGIPDLIHELDCQFAGPGSADILVDPLCGFQFLHDPIMGKVIVTDDFDYQLLIPKEK